MVTPPAERPCRERGGSSEIPAKVKVLPPEGPTAKEQEGRGGRPIRPSVCLAPFVIPTFKSSKSVRERYVRNLPHFIDLAFLRCALAGGRDDAGVTEELDLSCETQSEHQYRFAHIFLSKNDISLEHLSFHITVCALFFNANSSVRQGVMPCITQR